MSTKQFGCFFCAGKSDTADGVCDRCSKPVDVSEYLRNASLGAYSVDDILGRGFYGWTLAAKQGYQRFSIKVVPVHRLDQTSLADNEVKALVTCSPHPNIAQFIQQVQLSLPIGRTEVDVLCLVFEFIPGALPLRTLMLDDDTILSRSDVVCILAGISSGLARMHSRGLWHYDLHSNNVLIRRVERDENLNGDYQAKIIDFGSTRAFRQEEPESHDRGDYAYMAKHILELAIKFERGSIGRLTPADRRFVKILRILAQRVADKDVSRRHLAPLDLTAEVRIALEHCSTGHNFPAFDEMKQQAQISFHEPLANTNALTMAPQDVALLFRDSLGWAARIEKSEPVLVLGPRGCGKTMLLRYLSLESQARPQRREKKPTDVQRRLIGEKHIAFLVSVGQIRTPFIRSAFVKLQDWNIAIAEDFCRECINAHFAYEVLRTILWLQAEQLMPVSEDDVRLLAAVSAEIITAGGSPGEGKRLMLDDLAEQIDRRVTLLSSLPEPQAYTPTNLCRDDVLLRLARAVRATSWAAEKEVWFLLDDYSVTMLPSIAQRAYNPVLFRLSRELRVKISSEGNGPILEDSLQRKYVEGRELTKVNLGEIYFQRTEIEGRTFFEQILDARFKEIGKGSLARLHAMLGEHPHEHGFGEYIMHKARPGDTRFHGFGVLCSLCSGDVSFIIELLHALTASRDYDGQVRLAPKEQDEIIKRFAQRQLSELRSISDNGPKLYEFAEQLGNRLKRYLLDTKPGTDPDERLRIEIEGRGEVSHEAQLMEDSLLRHSVLIPGGSGKSKTGLPTRKLFPRRLFAPCFPFSPARKGCIDLTVREYEAWLLNPSKIANHGLTKRRKGKETGGGSELPFNELC